MLLGRLLSKLMQSWMTRAAQPHQNHDFAVHAHAEAPACWVSCSLCLEHVEAHSHYGGNVCRVAWCLSRSNPFEKGNKGELIIRNCIWTCGFLLSTIRRK